jgi:hypothetical protein
MELKGWCRANAATAVVVCSLLLAWTIPLRGTQQPPEPIALESALKVIMDDGATTLQRDAVLGKRYSGVITIADVEHLGPPDKPAIRVIAYLTRPNQTAFGKMSVDLSSATSNVDLAGQLRKLARIRVTGRLSRVYTKASGFVNVGGEQWVELVDATIDEVLPK